MLQDKLFLEKITDSFKYIEQIIFTLK